MKQLVDQRFLPSLPSWQEAWKSPAVVEFSALYFWSLARVDSGFDERQRQSDGGLSLAGPVHTIMW